MEIFLTANGDAVNPPTPAGPELFSEIAEFTKQGKFVGSLSIDPANGAAFGIAITIVPGSVLRLLSQNVLRLRV
jgi:hypothetical protein